MEEARLGEVNTEWILVEQCKHGTQRQLQVEQNETCHECKEPVRGAVYEEAEMEYESGDWIELHAIKPIN